MTKDKSLFIVHRPVQFYVALSMAMINHDHSIKILFLVENGKMKDWEFATKYSDFFSSFMMIERANVIFADLIDNALKKQFKVKSCIRHLLEELNQEKVKHVFYFSDQPDIIRYVTKKLSFDSSILIEDGSVVYFSTSTKEQSSLSERTLKRLQKFFKQPRRFSKVAFSRLIRWLLLNPRVPDKGYGKSLRYDFSLVSFDDYNILPTKKAMVLGQPLFLSAIMHLMKEKVIDLGEIADLEFLFIGQPMTTEKRTLYARTISSVVSKLTDKFGIMVEQIYYFPHPVENSQQIDEIRSIGLTVSKIPNSYPIEAVIIKNYSHLKVVFGSNSTALYNIGFLLNGGVISLAKILSISVPHIYKKCDVALPNNLNELEEILSSLKISSDKSFPQLDIEKTVSRYKKQIKDFFKIVHSQNE